MNPTNSYCIFDKFDQKISSENLPNIEQLEYNLHFIYLCIMYNNNTTTSIDYVNYHISYGALHLIGILHIYPWVNCTLFNLHLAYLSINEFPSDLHMDGLNASCGSLSIFYTSYGVFSRGDFLLYFSWHKREHFVTFPRWSLEHILLGWTLIYYIFMRLRKFCVPI